MSDNTESPAADAEPLPAATDQANDRRILASWAANAGPWTAAVREGQIASRRLATDRAIIDAVVDCAPQSVLDIGCGEGWLVRALTERGIQAAGVDAIPALIEQARHAGPEAYYLASYQDIAQGQFRFQTDALVCNFSLFGKTSVEALFAAAAGLLHAHGRLSANSASACSLRRPALQRRLARRLVAGIQPGLQPPAALVFPNPGRLGRLIRRQRLRDRRNSRTRKSGDRAAAVHTIHGERQADAPAACLSP